eukprot:3674258-Prymnesium_polylepis.1
MDLVERALADAPDDVNVPLWTSTSESAAELPYPSSVSNDIAFALNRRLSLLSQAPPHHALLSSMFSRLSV